MSANPNSSTNPIVSTDHYSIIEAFKIAGIVAALLVVLVITRLFSNAAIDLVVLRNVHSVRRYFSNSMPAFMNPHLTGWHRRVHEEEENVTMPEEDGQVSLEVVNVVSLMDDMPVKEKYELLSVVLTSQIATEESLKANNPESTEEKKESIPSSASDKLPAQVQCPICINGIIIGQQMTMTSCGHAFHFDCLCQWLGTGTTDCPYCRREIVTPALLENAKRELDCKKG
eukprot:scaffold1888_cov120-Cylindrotheca_fusiformis.AAC.20